MRPRLSEQELQVILESLRNEASRHKAWIGMHAAGWNKSSVRTEASLHIEELKAVNSLRRKLSRLRYEEYRSSKRAGGSKSPLGKLATAKLHKESPVLSVIKEFRPHTGPDHFNHIAGLAEERTEL